MQSLEDIPTLFSTWWGIDVVSAQLIMSATVVLMIVLPVLVLQVKVKNSNLAVDIILAVIGLFLCIALGWLPLWVLIVALMLAALSGAKMIRDATTGG